MKMIITPTVQADRQGIFIDRTADDLATTPITIRKTGQCRNRVMVIAQNSGSVGQINQSGFILCRAKEMDAILAQREFVEQFLSELFGIADFKLKAGTTNALQIPCRQDKRDAYYKH